MLPPTGCGDSYRRNPAGSHYSLKIRESSLQRLNPGGIISTSQREPQKQPVTGMIDPGLQNVIMGSISPKAHDHRLGRISSGKPVSDALPRLFSRVGPP